MKRFIEGLYYKSSMLYLCDNDDAIRIGGMDRQISMLH